MIKKIVLGALAFIVLVPLIVAGYLFSLKEDRPFDNLEPIATLHDKKYQDNAFKAEQWLKSVYETNLFPSFSVAVGIKGELTWAAAIGFSDLASRTLADQDSQYRIGSVSKPITATAAMRMHEKNVLAIDSEFSHHVSDYPAENSGFTIKQLLAHQGGVRHYVNELAENFSDKEYATTREAASIVENDKLLFSPGESFHYSTYGYTLLSLAMESAYAMPFEKIMHNEVFAPAAMHATQFEKPEKPSKNNIATPYIHARGHLFKSPDINVSNKYAGGGYLSTPSDVVRFANSLLNNTLITVESKEIMWSPVALKNGEMNPDNYALGFRVGQDDLGRFVHHGGKSVGGYSFLLIYPDAGLVVAFSTNVTPSVDFFDRLQEAKKVARFFLDNNKAIIEADLPRALGM